MRLNEGKCAEQPETKYGGSFRFKTVRRRRREGIELIVDAIDTAPCESARAGPSMRCVVGRLSHNHAREVRPYARQRQCNVTGGYSRGEYEPGAEEAGGVRDSGTDGSIRAPIEVALSRRECSQTKHAGRYSSYPGLKFQWVLRAHRGGFSNPSGSWPFMPR